MSELMHTKKDLPNKHKQKVQPRLRLATSSVYKRINNPNVYKHSGLTKETKPVILQDDTDPLLKRSGNPMRGFKVDANTGTSVCCFLVWSGGGHLKGVVIMMTNTNNSNREMS